MRTLKLTHIFSSLIVTGSALFFIVQPVAGVPADIMHAAGLTLFTIGFWATGIWPIGVTAVAFFFLAAILDIQPLDVIFSGFTSRALWLVFGGLVIGVSVNYTGLGARIAQSLVVRLGRSYLLVITGIAIVCMILGFLMPSSMGRVVLLVPIVMALAERLGYRPGSKAHAGMVLSTALITFTSAGTILPALVPGIVLAGLSGSLYGQEITYWEYLQFNFPVLGIIKCVFIILVTVRLFSESPEAVEQDTSESRMSQAEWMLLVILAGSLALWLTDFWHGISAAWVALGAALLILIPGLNLVPDKALNERIDYGSFLYTAAVLGLSVIVANSGLAGLVGQGLLAVFPFEYGAGFINYAYLALISTLTPLLTTNPGVPAVLSPLAGEFADATGLPLAAVLMTQVIGFTNVVLPYQASPIVVAMAMGGVSMADGARLTLTMTLIGFLLIIPLNFVWWNLSGLFG